VSTPSTPSERVITQDQILWHVDSMISWDAPDCHLPPQLRETQLMLIIGKAAFVVEQPKHCTRLMFELNAPDEATALEWAEKDLLQSFMTLKDRQPEGRGLPQGLDLHPDRIVLDRLAVRPVVIGIEPVPGAQA
jgi:hypothetical protein